MKKNAIIGAIIGLIIGIIINCMPKAYEVKLVVPARDDFANVVTWENANVTTWDDVYEQFNIGK